METELSFFRLLKWIGALMMLFAVGAWMAIFLLQRSAQKQASALLRETELVRVGETTSEDLARTVKHLNAYDAKVYSASICPEADVVYGAVAGNFKANEIIRRFRFLGAIGLQPWTAGAMFWVSQNKVCSFQYEFDTLRNTDRKQMAIGVESSRSTPAAGAPYIPRISAGSRYLDFTVLLYPEATPAERSRAFDFDFSCATSVAGCKNPCQIIRSAWPDFVVEAKERDPSLTPIDIDDPICRVGRTAR
jgi:hypothetical protein